MSTLDRAMKAHVQDRQVLVLGLGNVLRGDEGLGVHALQHLADRYVLPPEIEVVDGGTLGLDLLPYLDGTSALLVIDAVQAGRTPGSLIRLQDEAIMPALAVKLSLHQAGLRELLATSRLLGTHPAHVVLLGIEPDTIGWTIELSAPISASMNALVDAVADELRGWGVTIEDRQP